MENGEQKIFVWCDFTPPMDTAIMHGVQVASILRKELCLMHMTHRKAENREIAEARLRGIAGKIAPLLTGLQVHYVVLEGPLHQNLTPMAEVYDALVLVAHKNAAAELLPSLTDSGFPFLFVSSQQSTEQLYRRIIIPVGYMKKSKDLALWGSYFGRHNSASIDLFMAREGLKADNDRIGKNIVSIARLYRNFNFPFQPVESHTPTWKLQKAALAHAQGYPDGLLIIAASFKTTFIDNWMGLTERKVIQKSGDLSVMCINSQRDLYTLCG